MREAMIDVTEIATEIRHLITMGATERDLVALVARHHPDLDRKEFVAALQEATAAAEKRAARKH
jgi:hypothetical protein